MKAVVVGATGFLGLNIIEALKAADSPFDEIVATRRKSSNTIFLRRLKVPMVEAALEDVDSLVNAFENTDVVYFAAGHYPRLSVDTADQVRQAVGGAENLFNAARQAKVRRVIYTGSVVTVGRPTEDRLATEADGSPSIPDGSTYFAVKVALEPAVMAAHGVETIALSPTGCFGPFDHKVGTGFYIVGMANQALSVYTDGRINVVDARDVAAAHVQAATRGRPGERLILGGHNVRVTALLQMVSRLFGVPMPERCMTAAEAVVFASAEEERCHKEGKGRPAISREIVDMIVHGQFVDSSKAKTELGFTVRPLEDTLMASFEWYRANGFIRRNG
ncbi:MAG: hypothetical protein A2289_00545 [Deltaproteobacteria bacterium RIFOXYA12_FULL_58_15]|nr:MAG: hypothetical protein A2289_00545 [Deltaproteobacteria bacterium RIFOXYA12_FULL_58_15]OGR13353.1 MAG: hypothetical protein A2341_16000 [Deltaproteobacteria bacterium RIFOXYB12_FULL_58_9]